MTWLTNPFRFAKPTIPALQWRVWMAGGHSSGGGGDNNVRIAGIEMAETSGGSDISSTGTTVSSVTVSSESFAFDGNTATNVSTSRGDLFWVQKNFASAVQLAEMRLQAPNNFSSMSAPQAVIIMQRQLDTDPWDIVHVSTGLSWVVSEVKTLAVNPIVRPKGIDKALAWRINFSTPGVGQVWDLTFTGLPKSVGQAFSSTSSSGSQRSREAFDNDPNTSWLTTFSGNNCLGQIYADLPNAIPSSVVMIGPSSSGTVSRAPTACDVEWTDDMETWNLRAAVTFGPWSHPPQQTITIGI
jgi:hypothetical protein